MQSLFEKNVNSKRYKDDLKLPIQNSEIKSVTVLGSHIWNILPAGLKRGRSYGKFKTQISNWFGVKCNYIASTFQLYCLMIITM